MLVPQEGIEPPHPDYKTGPLPLRIQGQIGTPYQNRTGLSALKGQRPNR